MAKTTDESTYKKAISCITERQGSPDGCLASHGKTRDLLSVNFRLLGSSLSSPSAPNRARLAALTRRCVHSASRSPIRAPRPPYSNFGLGRIPFFASRPAMAASLPACQSDAAWKSAAPVSAHARCTYGSEEGGDAEMREEGKRAAVSRRSHPNP